MRMHYSDLVAMRNAMERTGLPRPGSATRERWDCLWRACDAGLFNVEALYRLGLNDDHIDTALRHIAERKPQPGT